MSTTSSRPIADWVIQQSGAASSETTQQIYQRGHKVNVLIQRGPQRPDREGLVLCGHLDVVPAEAAGWASDPWTLTERGDRWAGRGACDMKAFVALALDRFRRLEDSVLDAPLALLFTSDEEVGSVGAQRWLETGFELPRQLLIGEPTELRAVRMHKGHLRLRLTLEGSAAHSGYPHRGVNAIEPAGRAITALTALRSELEAERPEHHQQFAEVPFVTLNLGRIDGGVATNVIPDRCTLELGLRPLPGMKAADLVPRVEQTLAAALGATPWSLEIDNDSPPLLTPSSAPLYSTLCELLGQTGDESVSFASDGGTLSRAGNDCVLFGPGTIEVAHRPDEFVPKNDFQRAGEILDQLIERFCGVSPQ